MRDAVVVVTGASSGIGRATALACARRGAAVVLASRREDALREVAGEYEAAGATALVVPTDVTDADAVQRLAAQAVEWFGRIDVWVNCAASPHSPRSRRSRCRTSGASSTSTSWVTSTARGPPCPIPRARRGGAGHVSSVVSSVPQPYTHAYSMAKAAVRVLGASLRQELRLDGATRVTMCTVLPATIGTPFFEHAANYTGRQAKSMPPVYSPSAWPARSSTSSACRAAR